MGTRLVKLFLILILTNFVTASSASSATPVSYQTPTITLLPNNSLYKLQLVWDRLSLAFLFNPNKRAEKYVSLADRELTGAAMVMEKGDLSDGLHSAFRGENYMTLFVDTMKSIANESGPLDTAVIKRAHDAYPYHQQLLTTMMSKTSPSTQSELRKILEFSQRNETELKNLQLEFSTPKSTPQ